jgi:Arm DNA-binding domain
MSNDKLSDSKVRTAKPGVPPKAKPGDPLVKEYNLADGDGLYLRVKLNGSKLWLFNYYRPSDKKRSNISFGAYPDVTLSAARERRREARALLAQGIDPKPNLTRTPTGQSEVKQPLSENIATETGLK